MKGTRKVSPKGQASAKQTRRKRTLVVVPSLKAAAPAAMSRSKPPSVSPPRAKYNEKFVELLGELERLMSAKGEPFRARAYQNAAESVMEMREEIRSLDQLKGRPGIGKTIMAKLQQYLDKGDIDLLARERGNPLLVVTGVHGIGPKKAQELIDKLGITDVAGLEARVDHKVSPDGKTTLPKDEAPAGWASLFTTIQKKAIKYHADTQQRIPRAEVAEYAAAIGSVFHGLPAACPGPASGHRRAVEIVGSYRRGHQSSGDIDTIVTDACDNPALLGQLADALDKAGLIETYLTKGKTKIMAIARLPGKKARRLDLMYAPPDEFAFSTLYFTGSRSFNIAMRAHALQMGLSLSEHGLKDVGSQRKLSLPVKTEKDIFDHLGLAYKEPVDRVNSRSVVARGAASPKAASPKAASPKAASPKAASPKAASPKAASPKAASPKAASPKAASPKAASPKKGTRKKPKKLVVVSGTLKAPKTKTKRVSVMRRLQEFKAQGASYLATLSEKELADMVKKTNLLYRNAGTEGAEASPLSDAQYDILRAELEERAPNNPELHRVGATVERNKVELPFTMFSMDKVKADTGALPKWMSKMMAVRRGLDTVSQEAQGQYVVSAKLDGVSGLYTGDKLYTRGDGTRGQDVSNMIPYLGLPPVPQGTAVRGEFIFKKEVFERHYKGKYANARNLVSGVVNAKKSADAQKYKHLDFVAYEVVFPEMLPAVQLEYLTAQGFDVVKHRAEGTLDNDVLSDLLRDWRSTYGYEIDGLVVTDNAIHPRVDKNPEHAFAFKMVLGDQSAETVVREVIWTPSKHGYLKPKLLVDPVVIGGSTIQYVTAYNAKYIADNKIGVGTVIELIRSGDVIPKVEKVIEPAEAAQMPSVPYKWNESGVDIMVEQPTESAAVRLRGIIAFFAALKVDGFGPGTGKRLFEAGFDTTPKIVRMSLADMQAILGKKNGEKVHAGIKASLQGAPLAEIMGASGILGRGMGAKRLQVALNKHPDLLSMAPDEAARALRGVEGFAAKTADQFAATIPEFKEFLRETGITGYTVGKAPAAATGRFAGAKIAFTGFRDAGLAERLEAEGAEIVGGVSKNTTLLVVKAEGEGTGKADNAASLGIPVMTRAQLEEQLA
jgi:DNA ligase (NAD+)